MSNIYLLRPSCGNENFQGGEPPTGARLVKLEVSMEHVQCDVSDMKVDIRRSHYAIDSNFKLAFGGLVFVALGPAGVIPGDSVGFSAVGSNLIS